MEMFIKGISRITSNMDKALCSSRVRICMLASGHRAGGKARGNIIGKQVRSMLAVGRMTK